MSSQGVSQEGGIDKVWGFRFYGKPDSYLMLLRIRNHIKVVEGKITAKSLLKDHPSITQSDAATVAGKALRFPGISRNI